MHRVLLAVALLGVCSCQSATPAPVLPATPAGHTSAQLLAPLPDHDSVLAHRLVESGGVLLDVRTPDEYQARHLDLAVNIPVDDLESRLADVSKVTGGDPRKPIVVYCGSGKRAARAKQILLSKGYEQVTNLGGIDAWDGR